jgi:hypothetical protein
MRPLRCASVFLIFLSVTLLAQDNPSTIDLTRNSQASAISVPQNTGSASLGEHLNSAPVVGSPAGLTLLISQKDPYAGYGYGLGSWVNMTAALDRAFGAGNITVDPSDLDDLTYLMSFDRLLVVPRQPFGEALSATEISNIQAFIAAGRRVVLLGENSAWFDWNISILATVGGTYSGGETSDNLTRVIRNRLTFRLPNLQTSADGVAVGGISVFDQNVATFWAGTRVLTLLSVNVLDDPSGNTQLETNIAVGLTR